jgi:hypothetical protein
MLQLTLVVSSSLAFSFRFRTPLAVEFDWSVVQFNLGQKFSRNRPSG